MNTLKINRLTTASRAYPINRQFFDARQYFDVNFLTNAVFLTCGDIYLGQNPMKNLPKIQ